MIYGLEEHTITNSIETESVLSELSFDLIRENLREQIHELDNGVDYINPIEDRYNIIREEYEEDEDVLRTASETMYSLYVFILEEIADSFNIDINIDAIPADKLPDVAYSIYYFLVIKARKNITKFYSKFIIKNKKMLIEPYITEKRKDILSTVLKKQTKNKDDIITISKCPAIFKSLIFNMDFDSETMLKFVIDSEYHGLNVKNLINDDIIIGNIMDKYTIMIRDNSDLYDDVYARVYNKIVKKLIKN